MRWDCWEDELDQSSDGFDFDYHWECYDEGCKSWGNFHFNVRSNGDSHLVLTYPYGCYYPVVEEISYSNQATGSRYNITGLFMELLVFMSSREDDPRESTALSLDDTIDFNEMIDIIDNLDPLLRKVYGEPIGRGAVDCRFARHEDCHHHFCGANGFIEANDPSLLLSFTRVKSARK